MQDPAALANIAGGGGAAKPGDPRRSDVGACFQLALLAAGQGNDQEAGAYLRQIIASMKTMVQPGGTDAGASPSA